MDEYMLIAFVDEIEKLGMSTKDVTAKINAPNIGDTGKPGKGTNDPDFIKHKGKGFEKKGEMDEKIASLLNSLKSRR